MENPSSNILDSPPKGPGKPSYEMNNWIALSYVAIIVLTFFNKSPALADILFWVALATGLIGAASFVDRVFKMNKTTESLLIKGFFAVVGVAGGIVIFLIGFIAGLVGYFNNHPIQGD